MDSTIALDLTQENIPKQIGQMWVRWDDDRSEWLKEKQEIRQFLFATDTSKTSVGNLPWKNSTVTPKLTQIRDNLHANYLAALFPNENWFEWVAESQDDATKAKKDSITAFMRGKLRQDNFETVMSDMVLDYIDYGNVFMGYEYVNELIVDPISGEVSGGYKGPRYFRISPLDIVFDYKARAFDKSPKIVRSLRHTADFLREWEENPNPDYDPMVVEKIKLIRQSEPKTRTEVIKDDGYRVDGFANLEEYFKSGQIEVLEMYGDFFDTETGALLKNHIITVVDRRWILRKEPMRSWAGASPIFHVGWRQRPDNLWAQGPLDQLLGLQYRIDHLENLKADVFDQIAHPVTKISGTTVDDFTFGPGVKIYTGSEGDVEFVRPDATALNADMQINQIMDKMEELAGAPRQAMGIRTPGEKTKYEVQVLENGAGRIFQSKVNWFERNLVEPGLNAGLAVSVQHMAENEVVSVGLEEPDGTKIFRTLTKEDISGKGKLQAMGARHHAEKARFVQELTQTINSVTNVESIKPHISGLAAAKALEEALGWKKYKIVGENIGIHEQAETQRVAQTAQETVLAEQETPAELQDEDFIPPDESQPNGPQAEGLV